MVRGEETVEMIREIMGISLWPARPAGMNLTLELDVDLFARDQEFPILYNFYMLLLKASHQAAINYSHVCQGTFEVFRSLKAHFHVELLVCKTR